MSLSSTDYQSLLNKPAIAARNGRPASKVEVTPVPSKFDVASERKLQDLIANWLLRNGFYFVRQRMDRKSNTHLGAPDFHICGRYGRFIGIEVKVGANHATPDQQREIQRIQDCGGIAVVVRSLEEVITVLTKE